MRCLYSLVELCSTTNLRRSNFIDVPEIYGSKKQSESFFISAYKNKHKNSYERYL